MLLQEVVVVVLVVVVVFPVEGVVDLTGTPGTMMLPEMRMVFLEDTDLLKMLMEQGVVVLLVDTVLAVVVEVGGRRGGFANGESGDVERPRRTYERRSGTGRG